MTTLYVDLETRSRTDLKKSGPYRYVQDPDFAILIASWAVDDEPVRRWTFLDSRDGLVDLEDLLDDELVRKVAHNATFERCSLTTHFGYESYLPPAEWDDTMARAGEHGYPQSLAELAKALGGEQKDTAGTRLINLFCKPNRSGGWTQPADRPVEWEQFGDYCDQDVETLRDVDRRLPDWPTEDERRLWEVDQSINDLGFRIDVGMAEAGVVAAEENNLIHELEVMGLTGIANPGSVQQLGAWLQDNATVPVPNLQKATIEAALEAEPAGTVAHRVLELRQELALSASKKYQAALDTVCADGRIHGAFRFFGAHTGRWSGRGLQPQNLPREQLAGEPETDAAILDLMMGEGADPITLKALVRALLVGPLTVVDYAAIEARVVAWLAGETWALEAFRAGRDIYVETAERMGGLTRSQGKVAVLALGYNGAVNSLRVMGAQGSDEELVMLVRQWRQANPHIVNLWRTLDNVFMTGGAVGDKLFVERDKRDRRIVLPSGRAITYHNVRKETFHVVNKQTGKTEEKTAIRYANPSKPGRVATYGGKLTENVTQAVARDLLGNALVNLWDAGYPPVGHVHDEVLVEGEHSVDVISKIMCETPYWAKGFPLDGEGFTCRRYRKG